MHTPTKTYATLLSMVFDYLKRTKGFGQEYETITQFAQTARVFLLAPEDHHPPAIILHHHSEYDLELLIVKHPPKEGRGPSGYQGVVYRVRSTFQEKNHLWATPFCSIEGQKTKGFSFEKNTLIINKWIEVVNKEIGGLIATEEYGLDPKLVVQCV